MVTAGGGCEDGGVQQPEQRRRFVIPNVFMALAGALFLADGLSTSGAETLNPWEIVPGAVFLAGGAWNLLMTYLHRSDPPGNPARRSEQRCD